jgi:hypothetical protein
MQRLICDVLPVPEEISATAELIADSVALSYGDQQLKYGELNQSSVCRIYSSAWRRPGQHCSHLYGPFVRLDCRCSWHYASRSGIRTVGCRLARFPFVFRPGRF